MPKIPTSSNNSDLIDHSINLLTELLRNGWMLASILKNRCLQTMCFLLLMTLPTIAQQLEEQSSEQSSLYATARDYLILALKFSIEVVVKLWRDVIHDGIISRFFPALAHELEIFGPTLAPVVSLGLV